MKHFVTNKNSAWLFALLMMFFSTSSLFSRGQDLLDKVMSNDLEGVKELVSAGADLNIKDDMMDFTPLILSVYSGNKEMAEFLLSKGADINLPEERTGYTPLMHALDNNNAEMARFLIDKGTDIKIKANDGTTALILACGVSPDIAKYLLLRGADIHALTDKGQGVFTQCIISMIKGNQDITPEFAEYLLDKGAEIDEKNSGEGFKGYTPLLWAIIYCEPEIIRFLIENGADVNTLVEGGKTPLSLAYENCSEHIIELLKKHGAK